MKKRIDDYDLILLDCDGVILDSNRVKTHVFYLTAKPFGEAYADKLVQYHQENGGVSRFVKFSYFIDDILPEKLRDAEIHTRLLDSYSSIVYDGLLSCEIDESLLCLEKTLITTRMAVVSGSEQNELRSVFLERGIDSIFDAGVYGSPRTKFQIIADEFFDKCSRDSVLFVGDSRLDYEVASYFNFDFCFISRWSEYEELEQFASRNDIACFTSLGELL